MRYFAGDVRKVHAFFKKGQGRTICPTSKSISCSRVASSATCSAATTVAGRGRPWGLETCELIGSESRIIIREACEVLEFQPRFGLEHEAYHHPGGMESFNDTFQSRIDQWIADCVTGCRRSRWTARRRTR